jgi:hypothetical protein
MCVRGEKAATCEEKDEQVWLVKHMPKESI